MAVDLSGLKVGTAWRVETSIGEGVLLVSDDKRRPYVCYSFKGPPTTIHFKADGWESLDGWCVTRILHELKPVADITASDLDGRVIETDSGVGLFFADGDVLVNSDGEWGAGGSDWLKWADGCTTEEQIKAAYAAELERRRNPPVEIVWQGEFDEQNVLLFGWCNVRGEKWLAIQLAIEGFQLRHGREAIGWMKDVPTCEQYIRDHYASKDRAAEPA